MRAKPGYISPCWTPGGRSLAQCPVVLAGREHRSNIPWAVITFRYSFYLKILLESRLVHWLWVPWAVSLWHKATSPVEQGDIQTKLAGRATPGQWEAGERWGSYRRWLRDRRRLRPADRPRRWWPCLCCSAGWPRSDWPWQTHQNLYLYIIGWYLTWLPWWPPVSGWEESTSGSQCLPWRIWPFPGGCDCLQQI